MNSFFKVSFFCLVHLPCFSQVDSFFIDTIQPNETTTMATHISLVNLLCNQNQIYVYNESSDTLFLPNIDVGQFCSCDSLQVVDAIQINGAGSNEIVFYRKCIGETNEHGGTFDIVEKTRLHKYEVWNLDEKEMLFEVVTDYKQDYNRFNVYADPSHQQGSTKYRCHFSIDAQGEITIKNAPGKNSMLLNRKEGTYTFVNGSYVIVN